MVEALLHPVGEHLPLVAEGFRNVVVYHVEWVSSIFQDALINNTSRIGRACQLNRLPSAMYQKSYMKLHLVSLLIRLDAGGQRRRSYENSPERNSEPQNTEQGTAEFRRMVSLCSVFYKQTE
jgi:hypothetical protein